MEAATIPAVTVEATTTVLPESGDVSALDALSHLAYTASTIATPAPHLSNAAPKYSGLTKAELIVVLVISGCLLVVLLCAAGLFLQFWCADWCLARWPAKSRDADEESGPRSAKVGGKRERRPSVAETLRRALGSVCRLSGSRTASWSGESRSGSGSSSRSARAWSAEADAGGSVVSFGHEPHVLDEDIVECWIRARSNRTPSPPPVPFSPQFVRYSRSVEKPLPPLPPPMSRVARMSAPGSRYSLDCGSPRSPSPASTSSALAVDARSAYTYPSERDTRLSSPRRIAPVTRDGDSPNKAHAKRMGPRLIQGVYSVGASTYRCDKTLRTIKEEYEKEAAGEEKPKDGVKEEGKDMAEDEVEGEEVEEATMGNAPLKFRTGKRRTHNFKELAYKHRSHYCPTEGPKSTLVHRQQPCVNAKCVVEMYNPYNPTHNPIHTPLARS